jgi:hypothetical protein
MIATMIATMIDSVAVAAVGIVGDVEIVACTGCSDDAAIVCVHGSMSLPVARTVHSC